MSARAATRDDGARPRDSAHLGRTLRLLVLSPSRGYSAALAESDRRERAGHALPEGRATYVLAALGGVSLMLLWLKVGGALGRREVAAAEFGWDVLALTLVGGALVALGAQVLFAALGRPLASAAGVDVGRRRLRLVWGTSALPQAIAVLLLLPVDLLVVGTDTFTTEPLAGSVERAWAALSISLHVVVALWSLGLFVSGISVAARVPWSRALVGIAPAVVSLAIVVVALGFALVGLDRLTQ